MNLRLAHGLRLFLQNQANTIPAFHFYLQHYSFIRLQIDHQDFQVFTQVLRVDVPGAFSGASFLLS